MITTHIDDAQQRVTAEQDALAQKASGVEQFIERVEGISPDSTTASAEVMTGAQGVTAATQVRSGNSTTEGCAEVREAFAETIRPHSVAEGESEPLLETISAELTESVAAALAPGANTPLSPGLKRAILSEAESRTTEIEVMRRTLDSEAARLDEAAETVEEITDWITEADRTPLSELDFETLQRRHERLAEYREQCDRLAADRQAFLRETTSKAVETGVRHEHIIPQLYEDFPVEYPVLSTAGRLEETCRECQRAVRDHLVRRV
ncbi:hypothetical protein GRX03_09695 [Halovenus sp. WSH3]|uniref:DUF7260 domain-containing protein n=1 Tax=Halovenus carboxidivorans TaxID=2692199 RepID=A0A6B0T6R1_9EURY|nr:hypothetical protein [Halovenus carboxidivorans]MXR51876.1 hypothetical protein [Halovenus carboxidivorans]